MKRRIQSFLFFALLCFSFLLLITENNYLLLFIVNCCAGYGKSNRYALMLLAVLVVVVLVAVVVVVAVFSCFLPLSRSHLALSEERAKTRSSWLSFSLSLSPKQKKNKKGRGSAVVQGRGCHLSWSDSGQRGEEEGQLGMLQSARLLFTPLK